MNISSVWLMLARGEDVHEMGLPLIEGRIDLRNSVFPRSVHQVEIQTSVATVRQTFGLPKLRGVRWHDLDLSGCDLRGLKFFGARLDNCKFDNANCEEWGLWATAVERCSFVATNLKRSVLGGMEHGVRNRFQRTDFGRADLRQTTYESADFVDVSFADAKLGKVDFNGSTFARCVFSGRLEEVTFNRTIGKPTKNEAPPNEMLDVDFRDAELLSVEFRELDLDRVTFPADDDHIILDDYPAALDRLLTGLRDRQDVAARKMTGYFGVARRWVGKNQRVGVVNKNDLRDMGGEASVKEFLRLTRRPDSH